MYDKNRRDSRKHASPTRQQRVVSAPSRACCRRKNQTEGLSKQPARGKGSRGGGKKSSSSSSSKSSQDDGGAFKWEDARQAVLESMRLALTADASRLWRQGIPDRCFVNLFLRLSCKMLELPETVKSGRQADLALQLISETFHLAQGMETEFSSAVFFLVRENKHLADFVAKLCGHLVDTHGDSRLGAELVREVGRMDMPEISRWVGGCARAGGRAGGRGLAERRVSRRGLRAWVCSRSISEVESVGCSAGICTQAIGCCCGGKLVLVLLWPGWLGSREICQSFSSPLCRHTRILLLPLGFHFAKKARHSTATLPHTYNCTCCQNTGKARAICCAS